MGFGTGYIGKVGADGDFLLQSLGNVNTDGIVRGTRKNITPIILYEAISVGTAIALGETTQLNQNEQLYKQILKDFGSYESFEKDFKSTGAMRGIGWVILYFDKQAGRLFNVWINEHDMGHLGGNEPLLVMDVFEHAYMTDYGIKKADYIEMFIKSINFKAIEQRFNK